MSRNVIFAENEFYHLYNRGTDKRRIFNQKSDYDRFISLLYLCNGTKAVDIRTSGRTLKECCDEDRGQSIVDICAYCLMPNHFHLIVREKKEFGTAKFMQKLSTGYTMYFNQRYDRTGALFEGRFKAKHSDNDPYLSYLISYVHLNPVKLREPDWKVTGIKNRKEIEDYLERYTYSSYPDYIGSKRLERVLLEMEALPKYNDTHASFKQSVLEVLDYETKVQPLTEVEPL